MENKKLYRTPSAITQSRKVLIGVPTSESKNYCMDEFLGRIKNLSYNNYDILIADNSPDRHNYKKFIQEGVDCVYIKPKDRPIQATLAETHETIRQYALRKNYDYLFHLESDIIVPQDIIERLMIHDLPIVSGCYFIGDGSNSFLMIQKKESWGDIREVANIKDGADLNMMDGKLHEVFACGLGNVLIRRDVLEKIPFRWDGGDIFPDTYFSFDTDSQGIKKFVDTSVLSIHHNSSWTEKLLNNPIKKI
jgi:hypothetical protein